MLTVACNLSREVEMWHLQFFRSPAPQRLIDGYIAFHAESPEIMRATDDEFRTIATIVQKQLDAIGIEPWLRGGGTRHLLSRKLLLIAYLAECDAEHPLFRREIRGWLRSLVHLCCCALWAGWHLLKGRLQKALYALL